MVDRDIRDARRQMPASRPASGLPLIHRDIPWWMVGIGAVAASVLMYRSRPTCESVRDASSGVILSVCGSEYREAGNAVAGIRYADRLRKDGEYEKARAVAGELLPSSESADAWRVLGQIAWDNRSNDTDELTAVFALERSRDMNVTRRATSSVVLAELALSRIRTRRGEFLAALRAAEHCIKYAHSGLVRRLEVYCHQAASDALVQVGYLDLAERELEAGAVVQAGSPDDFTQHDQFSLKFEKATLHQHFDRELLRPGRPLQSIVGFDELLKPAWIQHEENMRLGIELNLAYSLVAAKRFDEADAHLATVKKLDEEGRNALRLKEISAQSAFGRGDLTRASALNAEIYDRAEEQDQKLDIATMQARIALLRNDFSAAERWASRGIDEVEKLRAQQPIELRAWVLSTRRTPYELRFIALARAKRIDDAVIALDAWHGRTVSDGLARGRGSPADLATAVQVTEERLGWLPTASPAPVAADANRAAVLATLRTIDAFALVVADGNVWRLTAIDGTFTLDDLGPYAGLSRQLEQFSNTPTDCELANKLGSRLLPVDLFRGKTTLHVLLDGPFRALSVVALRHEDRALISIRPVLRVTRLPEVGCIPAAAPDHATLLADPDGSLSKARQEIDGVARSVASKLHLVPRVSKGENATSAALLAAPPTGLVHLDVHGIVNDQGDALQFDGGALRFHDRDVSALEISSRRFGPRLVVMTACVSAISNIHEHELATSLSSAFLASGSVHVIATLRDIADDSAGAISTGFYELGGATDPVRGLQKIQAELANDPDTKNTAWPYFAVFGHEVCPSPH